MIPDAPVIIAMQWENSGQRSITAGTITDSYASVKWKTPGYLKSERWLPAVGRERPQGATIERLAAAGARLSDPRSSTMTTDRHPDGNALMLHHRYAPRVTEA